MKRLLILGAAIVLATIAAPRAHDPITTRVTWNADIAPLITERCVSCHGPKGSAPMSFVTYDQARPWARAIKEAALTRHMPNWRAARGYGDFLNDPSLSPFEIALIATWADGGAPKGNGIQQSGRQERLIDARGPLPRNVTMPCGEASLPKGTLVGARATLAKNQSVGIAVLLPDGRREIVAWIRDYDPHYQTMYWLRRPLRLPRGSTLITEGPADCSIDLRVSAR